MHDRMRRLSDRIGPRRAENLIAELAELAHMQRHGDREGETPAGGTVADLFEVLDELLDAATVLPLETPPPTLRPRLRTIFGDHHLILRMRTLSPGSAAPAASAPASAA